MPYQPKAFAVRLGLPRVQPVPSLVSQPVELPYNLDGVSLDDNRTDGDLDGAGNTLAGELLPRRLNYADVTFVFGPTVEGERNVVSCTGERIPLPPATDESDWTDLYLLLLATGGPAQGTFTVESDNGENTHSVSLYEYTEPIGQWNDRIVNGHMVTNPSEILPAYINHTPVAWVGTHRHTAASENDIYRFTYLYVQRIELMPGSHTLVLPNNPNIKLLAASVAAGQHDRIQEVAPLYDTAFTSLARIAATQPIFIDSTTVSLSSPTPGAVVRYSLDNSEPTPVSPAFTTPISLRASTVIKAKAFDQQNMGGATTSFTVQKLIPRPAVPVEDVSLGLQCTYYEGEWQRLPDFGSLEPQSEFTATSVAIPELARPEDYGLVFKGYINVPSDGLYEFGISSDDGSALWVADTLVADNDGIHGDGEIAGKVALRVGLHPIEARMFQCKGGQALTLYITGPGLEKQEVGEAMLFH
jgi:hypothetical protein